MVLSEKTLELNVIAELTYLQRIAGIDPYIIGFTQLEELYNGTDIHFQIDHHIMFLQFKKGHRRKEFYTYYVNNNKPHFNQHQNFLSQRHVANATRYVFPRVSDNSELNCLRGGILFVTPFVPAEIIGRLVPSNTHHRIRLWDDGRMTIHSDEKELLNWKQFIITDSENIMNPDKYQDKILHNLLRLPTLDKVLPEVFGNHNKHNILESIFGRQRSGFCMIFKSR